jgi:hypothetical protein
MVGHKSPDGTPGQPQKGIDTLVLLKLAGKWLIAAFNNTDSSPEAPFPMGPRISNPASSTAEVSQMPDMVRFRWCGKPVSGQRRRTHERGGERLANSR